MNKAEQKTSSEFDWSEHPIPKLEGFLTEITEEIKRQRESKRVELKERIQKMVMQEGMTLSQVFGEQPSGAGKKRGRAPVKYRHPETGAAWSGRGRKPAWMVTELEAGRRLEDFAV